MTGGRSVSRSAASPRPCRGPHENREREERWKRRKDARKKKSRGGNVAVSPRVRAGEIWSPKVVGEKVSFLGLRRKGRIKRRRRAVAQTIIRFWPPHHPGDAATAADRRGGGRGHFRRNTRPGKRVGEKFFFFFHFFFRQLSLHGEREGKKRCSRVRCRRCMGYSWLTLLHAPTQYAERRSGQVRAPRRPQRKELGEKWTSLFSRTFLSFHSFHAERGDGGDADKG